MNHVNITINTMYVPSLFNTFNVQFNAKFSFQKTYRTHSLYKFGDCWICNVKAILNLWYCPSP